MPTLVTGTRRDTALSVAYAGGVVEIATTLRPGSGGDLLLCLHGLGCAKESFDSAFADPALADPALDHDPLPTLAICAFDFPGHGGSGRLPADAYTIETYAEITAGVIRQLAPERLFLLAHSMGGAVGLVASQDLPRIDAFINAEGNLVAGDCGLVSRRVAAQPVAEFVGQELPRFRSRLAAAPRADLRAWGHWYGRADPRALHGIARSLVDWSDSGRLLKLFTSQPAPAYLHGSDSDLDYLWPSLDGVPVSAIAGSGHFPMVDNPSDFWQAVAGAIRAYRR